MAFLRLRIPTLSLSQTGTNIETPTTPTHRDKPLSRTAFKVPDPQLLSFEDLPEWYRDNEYILHGYRHVSGCVATSVRSLLYLHNESINIYTHLLPAVAFMIGEGTVLRHLHVKYPNVTVPDEIIFTLFILTAILCLLSSAGYHMLSNHSESVNNLSLRVDFAGIMVLTVGDFVSGIYMVFWCEPTPKIIYWTMVLSGPTLSLVQCHTNLCDLDCYS